MSEDSGLPTKRPYQDHDPTGINLGGILEESSSESEAESITSEAKGLTDSGGSPPEGGTQEENISSKKQALLRREATVTAEIGDLNKKLKKDHMVDKLRQEADGSSIVEQLYRCKKKLKKLENDRKVSYTNAPMHTGIALEQNSSITYKKLLFDCPMSKFERQRC